MEQALEHAQPRGLNLLAQHRMQAAPGHDVGFAPQDTGGGIFNIQEREQPERAFGMIKEQIDIGIFTRLASRRRAEQIEMLDAEPLQFGFVLLELGNNFAAFHRWSLGAGDIAFPEESTRLAQKRASY